MTARAEPLPAGLGLDVAPPRTSHDDAPPRLAHGAEAARAAAPSALDGMRCVLRRDLSIALRQKSDTLAALVFFVVVVSLFPLGTGAEPALLRTMAPGVVWVAALLASMLTLPRLFAEDHRDGTLDLLLQSPTPLALLCLAKAAAHWLGTGLLLAALAPLLALQFDLSAASSATLAGSLLLGTPVLSLVGSIGAALTVGVRGSGVLLSVLVLPLVVPVLVFGAGAVGASESGSGAAPHLSLLGAVLALALFLAPLAAAAALRISMD